MMRFHGISKKAYPARDAKHSGLFLLSAEYSFNDNFSIRPELGFLSRGGKLHITNLGRIDEGLYSVKASYFDIRVPVIYNFNLSKTKFKPYVYIAPLVGFPMGGKISLHETTPTGEVNDYSLKLSKANHAAAYFALVAGAGVKYPINILNHTCHIGLEFSYEYGITDTYSKMERKNQTVNVNHIYGPTASPRKNSGFELKVAFQVPLSIFGIKGTKSAKSKRMSHAGAVRNEPTAEGYYKTDCYTLQEIQQLIAEGKSVVGKTICAIDAINFDTAKSIIKDESKSYLNQLADVLIETGLRVEIKGHTDNVGTDESNMQLSKERALSVKAYLEQRGVESSKITYSYYGESRPMNTNDTAEGRLRNRRVEFELLKK
jgi:OOP family OmpA-OmpF porin